MNFFGNAVGLISRVVGASFSDAGSTADKTWKILELDQHVILNAAQVSKPKYAIMKADDDGTFFLIKEHFGEGLYHVVLLHENKCFSVFRSAVADPAILEFQRFCDHKNLLIASLGAEDSKIFKDLVDKIHNNPQWLSVHYACSIIGLKYDIRSSDVNVCTIPDGLFPLHIAAKFGNSEFVSKLIDLGASPVAVDPYGMNPLHYAALKDRQTLIAFVKSQHLRSCINNENESGETPLSLSVENSKSECFKTLLEMGASNRTKIKGKPILFYIISMRRTNPKHQECLNLLINRDPEILNEIEPSTVDTVFHLTEESSNMNVILKHAENVQSINKINKRGHTPLMNKLLVGNFDCFVKLLAYGADCTILNLDGRNVLHMAIQIGAIDFVKALLVFDMHLVSATTTMNYKHLACISKNPATKEILHLLSVSGAPICHQKTSDCSEFCSGDEIKSFSRIPNESTLISYGQKLALQSVWSKKKQNRKLHYVLSLDGGGIKGLLIIQTLLYISKKLGVQNLPEIFDWVAGTSTGAILAAAMARGKSLAECQRLYFQLKDDVFVGSSRPYDTATLEQFLKFHLGERTLLSNVKNVKLVITSVIANILPMKLHLFRNYQLPYHSQTENSRLGYRNPESEFLWKAARCSSAAPTFFACVDDKFIDGGIIANNPTLDVLTEILNYNLALKMKRKEDEIFQIGCILSIGTGRFPQTQVNTLKYQAPKDIAGYLNAALAIKDMTKILLYQITESDCRPVDNARSLAHSHSIPFFRFCTLLSKELPIDETDNKILIDSLWQTIEYLSENNDDIELLASLLVH